MPVKPTCMALVMATNTASPPPSGSPSLLLSVSESSPSSSPSPEVPVSVSVFEPLPALVSSSPSESSGRSYSCPPPSSVAWRRPSPQHDQQEASREGAFVVPLWTLSHGIPEFYQIIISYVVKSTILPNIFIFFQFYQKYLVKSSQSYLAYLTGSAQ